MERVIVGGSEGLTLENILALRSLFDTADAAGRGALSMEEFIAAFASVLGKFLSRDSIVNLFMKIDANSDGTVDWTEFTQYMLLENQGLETMKIIETSKQYTRECDLTACQIRPAKMASSLKYIIGLDAYVSSSEDDLLRFWQNPKSTNSRIQPLECSMKGAWWIDSIFMAGAGRLAVCASNRTISFFDANLDFIGRTKLFVGSPRALGYFQPNTEVEYLICGDDLGNIHIWELHTAQWTFTNELVPANPGGVRKYFRHKVHNDVINAISIHGENVISCSFDGAVHISDIEQPRVIRSFYGHRGSVNSFAWVRRLKAFASAGVDRTVFFWNPYSCNVVHEIIEDCPLVQIQVNEQQHQLITLNTNGVIKVWDLSTYSCSQVIRSDSEKFTSFLVHSDKLVLANQIVSTYQLVQSDRKLTTSHREPVATVLFNGSFHQTVTASAYEIKVWDINTGRLNFRFEDESSETTCISFDNGSRRLISGKHDGTAKIWNFNNGGHLGSLTKKQHFEINEVSSVISFSDDMIVNGFTVSRKYIVTTGWDRKILVYVDSKAPKNVLQMPLERHQNLGHTDDINIVVYCGESTIASAGDDGLIIVWNINSGYIKLRIGHSHQARLDHGLEQQPKIARRFSEGSSSRSLNRNVSRKVKLDTLAVENLVYLSRIKCLVSSGADGYIRFWDIATGEMMVELESGAAENESTITLTTDFEKNFKILTGDTTGILRIWGIEELLEAPLTKRHHFKIHYLIQWKAHQGFLTSIQHVIHHNVEYIITGSADTNVFLWKTNGTLIGQFGQTQQWDLEKPYTWSSKKTVNPLRALVKLHGKNWNPDKIN